MDQVSIICGMYHFLLAVAQTLTLIIIHLILTPEHVKMLVFNTCIYKCKILNVQNSQWRVNKSDVVIVTSPIRIPLSETLLCPFSVLIMEVQLLKSLPPLPLPGEVKSSCMC